MPSQRSYKIVALTLIVVLLLVACGNTSNPTVLQSPTPEILIVNTATLSEPITKAETPSEAETPSDSRHELFLQITDPVEVELVSSEPSITIEGKTRADAVVTLNDLLVEPNALGDFEAEVSLIEGPNVIEILASVGSEKYVSKILTVIYFPHN